MVFIIDSIHPIFCSHIWVCKIKVGIECRSSSSSLLCESNWIKRWNAKWKRKTHNVPTTKIKSGYQNADQVWAFCRADTFHDFSHQRFIWKVRKNYECDSVLCDWDFKLKCSKARMQSLIFALTLSLSLLYSFLFIVQTLFILHRLVSFFFFATYIAHFFFSTVNGEVTYFK